MTTSSHSTRPTTRSLRFRPHLSKLFEELILQGGKRLLAASPLNKDTLPPANLATRVKPKAWTQTFRRTGREYRTRNGMMTGRKRQLVASPLNQDTPSPCKPCRTRSTRGLEPFRRPAASTGLATRMMAGRKRQLVASPLNQDTPPPCLLRHADTFNLRQRVDLNLFSKTGAMLSSR